ncbi:unnamed protein product [Absidia cylindrospora]
MEFLAALLESNHRDICELSAERVGISFFRFIHKPESKIHQVIGQDLFGANIFKLNQMLSAASQPTITFVHDFNLDMFIDRLAEIDDLDNHAPTTLLQMKDVTLKNYLCWPA